MNDGYIRDGRGRIVGKMDGSWIRDGRGRLVAHYSESEDVTRGAGGRIVGRGDQRGRALGEDERGK